MKSLLVFLLFCLPCFGGIQAVIFDHGGVVVSMDRKIILQCLDQRMNIPAENLCGHSRKGVAMGLRDEGEFWDEVAEGSLPLDWERHFQQAYINATRPRMGMLWLVQHLQRRGYRTPLLSNVLPSCAAANEAAGRYFLFDPVVLSCNVGMAKPADEIYHYILDLLELEPEECLLIDDRIENLEPAAELGMSVIHFHGFDQLCQELRERGILDS